MTDKCFLHLFLELHTDGIGFFEVHSIAPQLVSEGGELVVPPLPESPLGQIILMLSPGHCNNTGTNMAREWCTVDGCDFSKQDDLIVPRTLFNRSDYREGVEAYRPIIGVPLIVGVVLVGLRLWIGLGQECDSNNVDLGTYPTCPSTLHTY